MAMYLYDPRHAPTKPPQTGWGKPSPGRCVAYACHTGRDWTVRDLRTGRTAWYPTRADAAKHLVGLAAADPALTLGGQP